MYRMKVNDVFFFISFRVLFLSFVFVCVYTSIFLLIFTLMQNIFSIWSY